MFYFYAPENRRYSNGTWVKWVNLFFQKSYWYRKFKQLHIELKPRSHSSFMKNIYSMYLGCFFISSEFQLFVSLIENLSHIHGRRCNDRKWRGY